MSVWIPVYDLLLDEPKAKRLQRALNNDLAEMYVIRLWLYCGKYFKSGKMPLDLIEEACQWKGESGVLLAALQSCEFVESDGSVHNWRMWAGRHLSKMVTQSTGSKVRMERLRDRKRGGGPVTRNNSVTSLSPSLSCTNEGSGEAAPPIEPPADEPPPRPPRVYDVDAIDRVFSHYLATWPPLVRIDLNEIRRSVIHARLGEFSEAEIKQAITNSALDDWQDRPRFSYLERHLLRDRDQCEKWLNFRPKPASAKPKKESHREWAKRVAHEMGCV